MRATLARTWPETLPKSQLCLVCCSQDAGLTVSLTMGVGLQLSSQETWGDVGGASPLQGPGCHQASLGHGTEGGNKKVNGIF